MHKLIRKTLRFIINHRRIYALFNKSKIFHELCYMEARKIIQNL